MAIASSARPARFRRRARRPLALLVPRARTALLTANRDVPIAQPERTLTRPERPRAVRAALARFRPRRRRRHVPRVRRARFSRISARYCFCHLL